MGWLLMLQTTVGAAGVTSRPYSASPTVRAAGNTNRPYREHCKGGWLSGWLPTHCKGGSNVNRPYSVGRGALLVSFSRSDSHRQLVATISTEVATS